MMDSHPARVNRFTCTVGDVKIYFGNLQRYLMCGEIPGCLSAENPPGRFTLSGLFGSSHHSDILSKAFQGGI